MSSSPSSEQIALADVRRQIDALDREILAAIEKRAALAGAVVAAKGGQHIFRPGREADLIRGLVESTRLPPQMIEVIWRQMIANNITRQQRLKIAMLGDDQVKSTASFCFGGAVDQAIKPDAGHVLDAVANNQVDLGVLPHWQDDAGWLEHMQAHQGRVYIMAVSPLIKGHYVAGQPLKDGVIVARQLPDASAADVTLCLADGKLVEHDGYHADADGLIGIFQKR